MAGARAHANKGAGDGWSLKGIVVVIVGVCPLSTTEMCRASNYDKVLTEVGTLLEEGPPRGTTMVVAGIDSKGGLLLRTYPM